MRVLWTEHALADLDRLLAFYEPHQLRYGLNLCQGALEAAQQLADFPELGPTLQVEGIPEGYRWLKYKTLKLIYRADLGQERVWILRAWDSRRDPDRLRIIDQTPED